MICPREYEVQVPDLLEAALEYARLGYPVFPCRPGQKKPLTQHGCNDASTDEATIRAWWEANPRANIGLVTDGLLVVDIDGAKNNWPGGEEGADLANAPTSLTPSGGRHHIFRQPAGKGWRSTTSRLAHKVDTRADGGYIVVSPSINGENGAYQWVDGLELDMASKDLPEPPQWLVAELDDLAAGRGKKSDATNSAVSSNSIPNGQRNATLTSLAGTMRRAGMEPESISAALNVENLAKCKPPMDASEVARIAKSVGRYKPAKTDWKLEVVPLKQVQEKPTDWLWNGRIPLGMLTVLEGPPKQGKSTVMYDLMARITTKREMPDEELSGQELFPCLIVAPEDPAEQVLKPRLMAAGANLDLVMHLKGFSSTTGKRRRFTLSDDDRLELERLIQNEGIKLVFVDAVMGLLPSKVDANTDQQTRTGILDPLADLATATGTSIVLGRHWAKGATGRQSYERGLGSIAWTGVARSVLQVAQHPDDKKFKLLAVGATNLVDDPPILGFRIASTVVQGKGNFEFPTSKINWEGAVDIDLEELGRAKSAAPSGRQECSEWLLARLGELGGDAPSEKLMQEAAGRGFSEDIFKRAKNDLKQQKKAISKKIGKEWRIRIWDVDAAATADEIFD